MKNLIVSLALALVALVTVAQTPSSPTPPPPPPPVEEIPDINPPTPPTPPAGPGEEVTDTTTFKIGDVEFTIKFKDSDRKNSDDDRWEIDSEDRKISIDLSDIDDEDWEDEIEVEVDRKRKLKNVKTRWLMLDLGVNTFAYDGTLNLPNELDLIDPVLGKSINVNLHALKQRVNLIKHHANLMYGLSFNFHNYKYNHNHTFVANMDSLTIVDSEMSLSKNKLTNTFMEVPLYLNFETNPQRPGRSVSIDVGVFGGMMIGMHSKQKSNNNGKTKVRDSFNMNKFRAGLMAGIGLGPLNFYAQYALTPLFSDGEGPELYPVNIGVSIIPF